MCPPENKSDLEKAADFFDEVILGGGAHIDDTPIDSFKFTPTLIIEITKLMVSRGKSVRWIGVSANNELKRASYIRDLSSITNKITEFTMRDHYSINVLRNSGIDSSHIRLVDDIAYEIGHTTKIICITLIDYLNNTNTIQAIVREVVQFTKESKERWAICFLPFYNNMHNDKILITNIISEIDFNNTDYFIAPEFSNIESMLLIMKGCDLFVNMRYHASLISSSYGKPTISIAYDVHPHYYNKMTSLHQKFKTEDRLIYFSKYKNGDVLKRMALIFQ